MLGGAEGGSRVLQAATLGIPLVGDAFSLETDASDVALGAVDEPGSFIDVAGLIGGDPLRGR